MAKLTGAPIKVTRSEFDALLAEADALPHGDTKGAIISFCVADGNAYYRVVKARPLVLEHIQVPHGGDYALADFLIKTLRLYEVERLVQVQRHCRERLTVEV